MQYNHWYWIRILILPHWIGIDHCMQIMKENWLITAKKLEWIESDWLGLEIKLDSPFNQSCNLSIICSIVNQWVTNHEFIRLIKIESSFMCVWFLMIAVMCNINHFIINTDLYLHYYYWLRYFSTYNNVIFGETVCIKLIDCVFCQWNTLNKLVWQLFEQLL